MNEAEVKLTRGDINLPDDLVSPMFKEDYDPKRDAQQPFIKNTQIAAYENLISDLQDRIERLQARNEKLDRLCSLAKSLSADANAEAESVIVELNNNIALETKKINDNRRKCDEIDKSRDELRAAHQKAVDLMEAKFEKTRGILFSQIKALNAKVNSIDDFKITEEGLRLKYRRQNEVMQSKEDEMNRKLQQIHYKTLEHRESLKKEAYKATLDVSKKFQIDLKYTVPLTVQRLMRETIVFENEAARLWSDADQMNRLAIEHLDTMEGLSERTAEAKSQKDSWLRSIKIQNVVLQNLKNSVLRMQHLEPLQKPLGFKRECVKIMEKLRDPDFLKRDYYKRELQIVVQREQVKYRLANEFKVKTASALRKCQEVVGLIKRIVDSAYNTSTRNLYMNIENMDLRTFAFNLMNLIEDYNSEKMIFESESSEEGSDLECKEVEFVPEIKIEEVTPESTVRVSTVSKDLEKSPVFYTSSSSTSSETESTDISMERTDKAKKEKRESAETDKILFEERSIGSYYEYEMEHEYQDFNDDDYEE